MTSTSTPPADPVETFVKRAEGVHGAIGADVDHFGGRLQCGTCGSRRPMNPGDAGRFLKDGWPKCCTYTMTWWTRRQIEAGEAPGG